MTSQAMILTKRLGILATDRQQTMADGKTYGGVKKIFELSKIHSLGVMINGNADFQDVPIETLIAEFKLKTDFRKTVTIEEIKNKLIKFLVENTEPSTYDEYLSETLSSFKRDLNLELMENTLDEVIHDKQRKNICPFLKKYSNFNNEFDDIIPLEKDNEEYTKILWEIFSFELQYEVTGIVLAGFDSKCHYPSFFEMELYFNDNGKIVYEVIDSSINSKKPIIKVFAINEEAYTFITGVNDDFIDFILKYISDANESIINNLEWDLKEKGIPTEGIIECLVKKQNDEYSEIEKDILDFRLDALDYTTYSIENLPEWLLCLFADFLIKLTAIKQKTTSEIETVSVDTDILIISKVDGLKWINRNDTIV